MDPGTIKLEKKIIENLKPAKVIKQHNRDIVGLDFSDDGSLLYTADSTTLNAYDIMTGKLFRKLFLKNHEIVALTHTHNKHAVLVATHKNHLILYWSIHENKVIKIFRGHLSQIVNIILCPRDDNFLTTSTDNTVRLWDLNSQSQECRFLMNLAQDNTFEFPVAAFDPDGLVYAIGWTETVRDKQQCRICIYDIKKNSGPFADWKKEFPDVKVMKFSPCGDKLLLATADNSIVLLDGFTGDHLKTISNQIFINQSAIIECSFSPDSQFIFAGSENGIVSAFDKEGKQITQLKAHIEKVGFIKFSPVQCLLISGGHNLIWWQPDLNAIQ